MLQDIDTNAEASLVDAIRKGDVLALADFIQLHRPRLLAFIRSITGAHLRSRIEIEDLFQEVATGAISALKRIPLSDLDPWSWLQGLARRRVIDAHRFYFGAKRRAACRQTSLDAAMFVDDHERNLHQLLIASITSPSAAVSRQWHLQRLTHAVAELSEEQQTILRLRYVEGLPSKDIAEQVGKTDAAVRVILTRSIRKLAEILQR